MEIYDEAKIFSLFNDLKSGNMSSFEEFYNLTKQQVFYNILAIVKDYSWAEEVLQDTYVAFLEHLNDISSDKNPLGYLFVVSKNKSFKFLQKIKKDTELEPLENTTALSETTKVPDDYIFRKMRELLSDKEYRIVILHVLDELSHKEIAKRLHKPLGSVTWSYSNAIKKLQKGLGEYYGKRTN